MTTHKAYRRPFPFCSHLIKIYMGLALPSAGLAQWPTSYSAPIVAGTGTDTRAGAIMAMPGGGAIVAFDSISDGARKLGTKYYDNDGSLVFSTDNSFGASQRVLRLNIQPWTLGSAICRVASVWAQETLDDVTGYIGGIHTIIESGSVGALNGYTNGQVEGFTRSDNGLNGRIVTFPWDRQLMLTFDGDNESIPMSPGENFTGFAMSPSGETSFLVSYTRSGPQTDGPSEVWLTGMYKDETDSPALAGPFPAEILPKLQQGNSQLTRLSTGSLMLTWLTKNLGLTSLHAKVVNSFGNSLSSPQQAFSNVEDYVATSSTLGIPVFAAVQHDAIMTPPVDRLLGGLINPSNGGTLTIPIAEGQDLKVKDLRQMADGDFRLTYSILEGSTHLLKVRCISGVTAGTLWETTIADLGYAPDEVVEEFPNTHIARGNNDELYILARYDQPGTSQCMFGLVRLRPDGSLGGE